MEYFNPKELKVNREVIKKRLEKYTGPTVRHKSGIGVLKSYYDKLLGSLVNKLETKILDCGTAGGGFVQDLHEAGFSNLYGLDIDEYMSLEKRRLLKEFKTADLSFDPIPWPDNFFNIITAWCVLPHLENPHNFIREIYRAIVPGGLFIMSLVNISSKPNRKYFLKHGEFPSYHRKNNHITLFTPAIFEKTVLKYFDLAGKEYFITPRIFDGWRGRIRKLGRRLFSYSDYLSAALEDRWGAKAIYVLKKKPTFIN